MTKVYQEGHYFAVLSPTSVYVWDAPVNPEDSEMCEKAREWFIEAWGSDAVDFVPKSYLNTRELELVVTLFK